MWVILSEEFRLFASPHEIGKEFIEYTQSRLLTKMTAGYRKSGQVLRHVKRLLLSSCLNPNHNISTDFNKNTKFQV